MKPTAIYLGHQEAKKYSVKVEEILRASFDISFSQHFAFRDQNSFAQEALSQYRADL